VKPEASIYPENLYLCKLVQTAAKPPKSTEKGGDREDW
jgi:hypothetical protein